MRISPYILPGMTHGSIHVEYKKDIEHYMEIVSNEYGVTPEEMKSHRRFRNITVSRQVCMYLIRKFTQQSLKDIGAAFGGRDHTTVIHACHTVQDLLDTDEEYREKLEHIVDNFIHLTDRVKTFKVAV